MTYRKQVKDHYREQVKKELLDPTSTMPDEIIRIKEIDAFKKCLDLSCIEMNKKIDSIAICEIGCGNGTLLEKLKNWGCKNVTAFDFLEEFVDLSQSRNLGYQIDVGDVSNLKYEDNSFDVILSERVVINLLDKQDQKESFKELNRILRPNSYLFMFEAFENALHLLNEARSEFELEPIKMPAQNRWFKESEFQNNIIGKFEVIDSIQGQKLPERHLLSSHYFLTRVLHDLLLYLNDGKGKVRNSLFAKFFSETGKNFGEFGPVQFIALKKIN